MASSPHLPENVFVAPGVEASRFIVELVAALVVLDDVSGGAFLDVHAFVAVRFHDIP